MFENKQDKTNNLKKKKKTTENKLWNFNTLIQLVLI